MQKTDLIWMDGKFVRWDDANVHILTHTLHYGLGVFEGIRCYETDNGPAIFRLREHITRLFDSAKMFGLEIPFSQKQIEDTCCETIAVNKMKSGYLRPLVYVGAGEMGLGAVVDNPIQVSIAAWGWGAYLGEDGLKNGIRAKVSSFARTVNLPKSKTCGNYVNSILAKRDAHKAGYQEAILLDHEGYLAEGPGENLFAIRDQHIVTPPVSSPILKGITRDTAITLARDLGYTVTEARVSREEVYVADEFFMTGTAAEITPVRELDDITIGTGKAGPMTLKIQDAFFAAVRGRHERSAQWLTPVRR